MLSPHLLDLLRAWWKVARPQGWLFPGRDPVQPLTTRQLNRACHAAAQMAEIEKTVSLHTLRHSPHGELVFITLARTRLDEFASAAGGMRDPQDREVELSFWESVRESDNPASLKAYLEKYPTGEFKSLAEIRLNELDAQFTSR
jgi:integrase